MTERVDATCDLCHGRGNLPLATYQQGGYTIRQWTVCPRCRGKGAVGDAHVEKGERAGP